MTDYYLYSTTVRDPVFFVAADLDDVNAGVYGDLEFIAKITSDKRPDEINRLFNQKTYSELCRMQEYMEKIQAIARDSLDA